MARTRSSSEGSSASTSSSSTTWPYARSTTWRRATSTNSSQKKGIGGFDKTVVVKRILENHLDDPVFLQMFLDEARIAAFLHHPNIVETFEIDEADGVPFIAMEYIRGQTLETIRKRAAEFDLVDIGHIASIISKICQGLSHAHNAIDSDGVPLHIVHRDVTPQNIIVSYDGVPKRLDFGVARAQGRLSETPSGTGKGKLHFMAPEQRRPGGGTLEA